MKLLEYVQQDYKLNEGRKHIQLLLVTFRLSQFFRNGNALARTVSPFFALLYRLPALFMYGIDIPTSTRIGSGLQIHHGFGIVVNSETKIAENVTIRQGVTIGNKSGSIAPILAAGVDIGAGAIIIGPIVIGERAVVGAGAVVTKDVPAGQTVAGNPARLITSSHQMATSPSVEHHE